jgi:hypothetical protein
LTTGHRFGSAQVTCRGGTMRRSFLIIIYLVHDNFNKVKFLSHDHTLKDCTLMDRI